MQSTGRQRPWLGTCHAWNLDCVGQTVHTPTPHACPREPLNELSVARVQLGEL